MCDILHVLVKWPGSCQLDVYPVDRMVDVDVGLQLINDRGYLDEVRHKNFLFTWDKNAEPAEAIVVDVGSADLMEKKRSRVLKAMRLVEGLFDSAAAACGSCDSYKRRVEDLERENERLQRKLSKAKKKCDMQNMVTQMSQVVEAATQERASAIVSSPKVDIGLGVLVDEVILHRIGSMSGNCPKRYARGLMRAVFTTEELCGGTLTGNSCNAKRELSRRPALDQTRVSAVLGYVGKKFNPEMQVVKGSLATMLAKMKKSNVENTE
ncbi:uncharacterized protein LOC135373996 [Ornithodoros turicata]|uniref:uncharacterized protein LOC135373996 n=1 Tax=Ornithodoros turicata TaxID=34597 RepID=UPI003138F5B1